MSVKTTSYRKPDLLLLLTFCVTMGSLLSGVAQAANTSGMASLSKDSREAAGSENWWQSIWGLDLARKLKDWRPKVTVQEDGEGFNLARPFGKSGPTVQCSSSLPDSVWRGLRAGGAGQTGVLAGDTDVFLFLQKRW